MLFLALSDSLFLIKRFASNNSLEGEVAFRSSVVEQLKLKNKNKINISADFLGECIRNIVFFESFNNTKYIVKSPMFKALNPCKTVYYNGPCFFVVRGFRAIRVT